MSKYTIAGKDINVRIGRGYVLDSYDIQDITGVRQEVFELFNEPKLLLRTSNMNALLGDIVEARAGNVSSDSQELTIIGGTSSATGNSWMYWNLPSTASKVYAKAYLNSVSASEFSLEFCNDDGSTFNNPPDRYYVDIMIEKTTEDFRLHKNISGSYSTIAYESVDLSWDIYYLIEFYWEYGIQKVWRDGVLKFNTSDTDISLIKSVRFRCYDDSTSSIESGKVKGPVIIIYE